eukprot:245216-Pelagomonas_calceolata.AAC.21
MMFESSLVRGSSLPVCWLVECHCPMYASQVWGTEYVKEGQEFSTELQVRHMRFLGHIVVKRELRHRLVVYAEMLRE